MRAISEDMAARLESGVTTMAHVWLITRRDNAVFGFTDHDRALTFDGVNCQPSDGLMFGAIEKSIGLGIDSASIAGALESEAISEAELARGLWDGARVDVFRVDWTDPSLWLHMFAGRIGEVRRGAQVFEAELRGLQAPLNVAVGRVFSRYCDADLGDARCGVDAMSAAYRGEGVVTEVISSKAFRAEGLEAFEAGWFTRGALAWSVGGVSEISAHRVEAGGAAIELFDVAHALELGAAFSVTAGCDKRFETCRAKFANILNFRGFPHMPGNDAVQAGPVAGERLDGGSRFS